jgi:hypothetical protein
MLLAKSFMKLSDSILLFGSMRMLLAESFMKLSDSILLFGSMRMLLPKRELHLDPVVQERENVARQELHAAERPHPVV